MLNKRATDSLGLIEKIQTSTSFIKVRPVPSSLTFCTPPHAQTPDAQDFASFCHSCKTKSLLTAVPCSEAIGFCLR